MQVSGKKEAVSCILAKNLTCSGPTIDKIMVMIVINYKIKIKVMLVHDTSECAVAFRVTSGCESIIN
jgi:hypothetical protein